jgi:hypothetical protein
MKITEENYEISRKYVDAMYERNFYNPHERSFFLKLIFTAMVLTAAPIGIMMIGEFFSIPLTILMTAGFSLLAFGKNIMLSRVKKLVKKDCPDFDTNVNIDELEKELVKFEEKSNNPVALDNRVQKSLIKLETLAGKDSQEILSILKEEKEFWEKVVETEKEEEAEKVMTKKMC